MLVLGVDAHKRTHTAVAVDAVGKQIGHTCHRANDGGHRELIDWARHASDDERVWAVEDCRHVSGRLERALISAGEHVVRVPPKLMAAARTSARTRGKSDPIDALAVARAYLREPELPAAGHDPASREIKLLTDHRDALVTRRTQAINRLRWHVHDLDPDADIPARRLHHPTIRDRLAHWLADLPSTVLITICQELIADIATLTERINTAEHQLQTRVRQHAPRLTELPGCGALTAAKILAETAGANRFRSEACFAMHAGAAPVPASSGNKNRHRLTRTGNRQLNAALHRIALTQTRLPGPGRDYYQRRRSSGDSSKEAIRALKRKVARAVFANLKAPTPLT